MTRASPVSAWRNDFEWGHLEAIGRSGFVIRCACCGREGHMASHRIGQALVEKWFKTRGWTIGHTRKKDRCPACRSGRRPAAAAPSPAPTPEVPMPKPLTLVTPPAPPVAEEPRKPMREERRTIFDALDDAYDVKAQ